MNNIPVSNVNSEAHRRQIAQTINLLIPVVKSIALTTSSATTTITDEKMGEDKTVVLIPTDSDAASENWYLSSKLNGSFVITHSNNALTRTFDYTIVG